MRRLFLPALAGFLLAGLTGCGGCCRPAVPPPPPTPTPVDPPAPIAGDGLRVLVVYDDAAQLPPGQLSQLTDAAIRAYLQQHCAKAADGSPEFRFFTAKTDAAKQARNWRDAFARPRSSLPWLVVSNGKTGYEGPLPADRDATLTLLKKFGG